MSDSEKKNIFDERRFGVFNIDAECIGRDPDDFLQFMRECIVVRATYLYDMNVIEYAALHPLFDSVQEGCQPPHYTVICTRHEDGRITHSFEKQKAQ